jgi:hypothetical protein
MRFFVLICVLCAAFFSCTGGKTMSADGYVTPDPAKGVNIHPTAWMYTALDGRYFGTLERGELVTMTGKSGKTQDKGWDLSQVKRQNGQDVWVFTSHIVPGTRPGVIVKEGFIYSEPLLSKLVSNEKIDEHTIVAGLKDPKTPEFVQVSYAKPDNQLKYRVYVKSDMVSFLDSDILASILYDKALKEKNQDAKKELLSSAMQLDSPAFKQAISAELAGLEGGSEASAAGGEADASEGTGIDSMDTAGTYLTTEDDVACYEGPSMDSAYIGSFKKDEKLSIDRRTKETEELGGTRNYWFHVKDKGWVFGAYIIETNN